MPMYTHGLYYFDDSQYDFENTNLQQPPTRSEEDSIMQIIRDCNAVEPCARTERKLSSTKEDGNIQNQGETAENVSQQTEKL